MKVLVTGVTGFLGGRVAHALLSAAHEVYGLVRDPARLSPELGSIGVRAGDVTDAESFRRAAAGCEAIVHAAAYVKNWARDRTVFDRVNVGGLRNAWEAASEIGAKLVYTSSFMALGPTDGTVLDEESPRMPGTARNDYERTKWEADRLARRLAESGATIVRLYPGIVFGPGALTAGNHVVRGLLQHAAGKMPGLLGPGDRRLCFAYVEDVAAGFVAATELASAGAAYVLGGENRTTRELFDSFGRLTGIEPPRRRIPYAVATAAGWVQRKRADWFGTEPELTDEVVGIYRREWAYSSARAEREIGYRITPFDEAMARTVAWLEETGALRSAGPSIGDGP